jgi:tetratricopeptide (TPR) repeat protein
MAKAYRPGPEEIKRKKDRERKILKITLITFACCVALSLGLYRYMNYKSSRMAYQYAQEWLEVQNYSKAVQNLDYATYKDEEYADAYLLKGKIDSECLQMYSTALKSYNSAIQYMEEPNASVYYLRGKCNYKLLQYNNAISDLEMSNKIGPAIDSANFYLSEIYSGPSTEHDESKALAAYDRFLSAPRTPVMYLKRGICKNNLKDYKGAITDFDKALTLQQGYGEAYYNKALAEMGIGDTSSACTNAANAFTHNYDPAQQFIQRLCMPDSNSVY